MSNYDPYSPTSALALSGTTVGKALFGIRVTQPDGRKPHFLQAMNRTEKMLRSHFYLIGFPVLMLPSVVASFSHIKRSGSAKWDDRANTVLSVRPLGALRLLLVGGIGVVVLMGIVIADRLGKDQTKADLKEEIMSELHSDMNAKKHPPVTYAPSSHYSSWETVSIPGICTYQIPPTVEIQKGTYKRVNDQFRKTVLEIDTTPDRVVAQPKGINDFDPVALKRYCRIIVETKRGSKADYCRLDEPLAVSALELRELDKEFKGQIQQAAALSTSKGMKMTILSWQPTKIVRVNGVDALLTTYTRSMNDAPSALVRMYKIQNNDCLHTITISYREAESDHWAEDFGKVIGTFKFSKR